jgi:carboxyl-terminal processing protease
MKNKILFALLGILLAGVIFLVGINIGQNSKINFFYTLPVNAQNAELLKADFSLFWDALKVVKDKYYNPQAINDQNLVYGAINGALSSLNDPYTVFFNPDESKKFNEDLSGSFGGIGAELGMKNNQLVIIAPLKNTPAERSGLKAGDQIMKINNDFTTNITVDQAVKLIRGEIGTKVSLDIMRSGWEVPKTFTITRELIKIPTLDWKMLDGNIAYVALYNFYSNAPNDFYNAMLQILPKNPKGLILDLRNNPGGFLDASTNIAGWFVKRGETVVIERGKNNNTQRLYAFGNEALLNLPTVVLVNGGTASAAEILAGALRDDRQIKLVGEQTFGKGSVQEIENLPMGSSLKVTIAEWLTPYGNTINKTGLKPDYEVKMEESDVKNNRDPQLQKAEEILSSITTH